MNSPARKKSLEEHKGDAEGHKEHEKVPEDYIPEGMSKNQWKKRLKQQRIEQGRPEWKKRQKEKDQEKKRKRREEGVIRGPPIKKQKMSDSTASPLRIAIELGYQDLMTDVDIKSLMKQCERCYAANRRAESPLQLHFTSFGGRFKQRMEHNIPGHVNWDVHFESSDYVEVFGSENIVYLAAESPNVLRDVALDKVYVIGGLVDHNHYKGYCYQNALSKGVAHAQLPISEYITLKSRKVLTVNHVFEILVAFVKSHDWKVAFHAVIPLRKQDNQTTKSYSSPDHTQTLNPHPRHSDANPPHAQLDSHPASDLPSCSSAPQPEGSTNDPQPCSSPQLSMGSKPLDTTSNPPAFTTPQLGSQPQISTSDCFTPRL